MKSNIKLMLQTAGFMVVALAVVLVIARGSAAPADIPANVDSAFIAEEYTYDFGAISMKRGDVIREYRITNSSANPVTIEKVYTSCMCTQAELIVDGKSFGPFGMPGHGGVMKTNAAVLPNQTIIARVIFDPAAHGPAGIGPVSRVVTFEDNAGGVLQLQFSAVVTP